MFAARAASASAVYAKRMEAQGAPCLGIGMHGVRLDSLRRMFENIAVGVVSSIGEAVMGKARVKGGNVTEWPSARRLSAQPPAITDRRVLLVRVVPVLPP